MGATSAMQDAICLANWINVLPSSKDIKATQEIFEEYYQERHAVALEAHKKSKLYAATTAKVSESERSKEKEKKTS